MVVLDVLSLANMVFRTAWHTSSVDCLALYGISTCCAIPIASYVRKPLAAQPVCGRTCPDASPMTLMTVPALSYFFRPSIITGGCYALVGLIAGRRFCQVFAWPINPVHSGKTSTAMGFLVVVECASTAAHIPSPLRKVIDCSVHEVCSGPRTFSPFSNTRRCRKRLIHFPEIPHVYSATKQRMFAL